MRRTSHGVIVEHLHGDLLVPQLGAKEGGLGGGDLVPGVHHLVLEVVHGPPTGGTAGSAAGPRDQEDAAGSWASLPYLTREMSPCLNT